MPYIDLNTNIEINNDLVEEIKSKFGELIEILPGKSEDWLMVKISQNNKMFFKGSNDPLIMVEVKIYGSASKNSLDKFTSEMMDYLSNKLKVNKNRIYITYSFSENWGWNGFNF